MKPHSGRREKPEIEENLSHQRSAWVVQRIALWTSGSILTVALLGLFGRGGFGRQQVTSADGSITVHFGRFLHRESPEFLKLSIRVTEPDAVQVWIPNSYFDAVELENIFPEPSEVRCEQNRVVYHFAASGTNMVVRVRFNFRPDQIGSLPATVGLESGTQVRFKQFVYP